MEESNWSFDLPGELPLLCFLSLLLAWIRARERAKESRGPSAPRRRLKELIRLLYRLKIFIKNARILFSHLFRP